MLSILKIEVLYVSYLTWLGSNVFFSIAVGAVIFAVYTEHFHLEFLLM